MMNRIYVVLLILMTAICSYSIAQENGETSSQFEQSKNTAYLRITEVQEGGSVVALDDGSEWSIKVYEGAWNLIGFGWTAQNEVSHWAVDDVIEIRYPRSGNFIDFALRMANVSKQEEAWVTLKQAPSVDYSACLWVVNDDAPVGSVLNVASLCKTSMLTISDGTVCVKIGQDLYGNFFQLKRTSSWKWEPGDPLTLIRGEGLYWTRFFLWNHITNQILPLQIQLGKER